MKKIRKTAQNQIDDTLTAEPTSWRFDASVTAKFGQHAERSIPKFRETQELIAEFSDFFLHEGGFCYDLGCSDGALLTELAKRHRKKSSVRLVGLDASEDMVTKARVIVPNSVDIINADIIDYSFEKADLIIAHYTIQFVAPRVRQLVFNQIYNALNWGGALLLFEKTRAPDARFQDISTALYAEFKKRHGFSAEEILNKTAAIRGVLEPFSTQGNIDLMHRAGFVDINPIFKWINFEGFLAIK
ncbi:MAG: methyltransferase domain-containing protein [Alphaproteobacteria bacterium]|nr:methyltransferase domain-containing protein [Alphaproteobacteria bacterium]